MKVVISVVLAGIVLILTIPVHAHHSTTAFYLVDEQFEISGTVIELRLVNPHSYMRVEVTEPSGEKVVWTVYGGNRNQMTDEPGWEEGTNHYSCRLSGEKSCGACDVSRITMPCIEADPDVGSVIP